MLKLNRFFLMILLTGSFLLPNSGLATRHGWNSGGQYPQYSPYPVAPYPRPYMPPMINPWIQMQQYMQMLWACCMNYGFGGFGMGGGFGGGFPYSPAYTVVPGATKQFSIATPWFGMNYAKTSGPKLVRLF